MRGKDIYLEKLENINLRTSGIEKLLQLLLVNSLVEDVENIVEISEQPIEDVVSDIALKYGLQIDGCKKINNIDVIIFQVPREAKVSIKDIKQICFIVEKSHSNLEPVFMYTKINGRKKKSMIQENISFGVKGKELHISK